MSGPKFSCVILGCGRSGTSLMAGLLGKAGFFHGDRLLEADRSNPTGYFEDRTVEEINEALLARQLGGGLTSFVDRRILRIQPPPGVRWLAAVRRPVEGPPGGRLQQMIRERTSHHPFCYKDPRFCHTLRAWLPDLPPSTRYVVVFRDPAATAQSMLQRKASRPYARQFRLSPRSALRIWWTAYRNAIDTLPEGASVAFVHYHDLLARHLPPALTALMHGVPIDFSIVNPALNRSHHLPPGFAVPQACLDLYQELCQRAGYRRALAG